MRTVYYTATTIDGSARLNLTGPGRRGQFAYLTYALT